MSSRGMKYPYQTLFEVTFFMVFTNVKLSTVRKPNGSILQTAFYSFNGENVCRKCFSYLEQFYVSTKSHSEGVVHLCKSIPKNEPGNVN